ncbi:MULTISPECIES: glutaredoxin family protein [Neobacillus]|uniref:Glutaredoxin family protein n=1 Tax=Neobacillus rhizophilus TaxID=2833579 RepID=A0A942YX04_9BACI|nr:MULTISPECIES: glutaredoxin family protein [Neobacillus]MBS4213256.1 glutaredoxin family protein [Neobacillus rhizophilus]
MPQTIITLYTRNGCPLCDKAKAALLELKEEYDFSLDEIDIEQDDELHERYGLMIPVVHIDGEEAAYGFINKFEISNRLQEKS